MANGEEGARYGFIYGFLADKKKFYDRKINRVKDVGTGIAAFGTIFALGTAGNLMDAIVDLGVSYAVNQVNESLKPPIFGYGFTRQICALSFYQHTISNYKEEDKLIDGACMMGVFGGP
ncbi:MAG: hypothetical protein H7A25_11240 [Leptospiraceae bacterium]|nr:hypothetical protein [Leptospiraceae bacterium]MCP5500470.1 hypothetical protein [Leptospiraceae bacterium]